MREGELGVCLMSLIATIKSRARIQRTQTLQSTRILTFVGLLVGMAAAGGAVETLLNQWNLPSFWSDVSDVIVIILLASPFVYRIVFLDRKLQTQETNLILYQRLIENTLQGIMITDASKTITYVNPGFTRTTGFDLSEMVGQTPRILQSGRQSPEFYRHMWSAIYTHGQWQGEIWNRRKNGEIYAEWLNITAIRNARGRVTHYVAIFADITSQKLASAQLEASNQELLILSNTDTLTDLANRRSFEAALESCWQAAHSNHYPLSLIMLDIDFFKEYNDHYGHLAGDECLRQIADVARSVARRQDDVVARFGGEEFILLLPHLSKFQAATTAEQIRSEIIAMAIPHSRAGSGLGIVSVSLGVSCIIPTDPHPRALVERADHALYHAKHNGRNLVMVDP